MNPTAPPLSVSWRWRHFDAFSGPDWHRVLKLRAEVFVVEQRCLYLDPDPKDPHCWHLELIVRGELLGTLRVAPPGIGYDESSVGRVCIHENARGQGLARQMMHRAIEFSSHRWNIGIRLSAQLYLQTFYESLGFAVVGAPYEEDGIPHIEMLLPP